jgi:hypothetical protein
VIKSDFPLTECHSAPTLMSKRIGSTFASVENELLSDIDTRFPRYAYRRSCRMGKAEREGGGCLNM